MPWKGFEILSVKVGGNSVILRMNESVRDSKKSGRFRINGIILRFTFDF